jgi:hypothetical protein
MTTRPFNRDKMQWLTAICKDYNISATSFRIAYLIGDHFNSMSGEAWPSHQRIASILRVATKTVQRAARDLEDHGWLEIRRSRSRRSSNRYRIRRPTGVESSSRDNSEPSSGHLGPRKGDDNVRQSFSENLTRTFLNGSRGKTHFPDRGRYEQQLIERFGDDAEQIVTELHERASDVLDVVCLAQKENQLTEADWSGLRLFLQSLPNAGSTGGEWKR